MKKFKWIAFCIVILCATYFIYDFLQPNRIQLDYPGIIYSNESKFEKKTKINIKGKQYKNHFGGEDLFIGELTVDGNIQYEFSSRKIGDDYIGILTLLNNEHSSLNTKEPVTSTIDSRVLIEKGSIVSTFNFDKVWIQINEINQRYNIDTGHISGPANKIDEAYDIERSLLEGNFEEGTDIR